MLRGSELGLMNSSILVPSSVQSVRMGDAGQDKRPLGALTSVAASGRGSETGGRTFLCEAVTGEAAPLVSSSISGCQRTTFATHTEVSAVGRGSHPASLHRGRSDFSGGTIVGRGSLQAEVLRDGTGARKIMIRTCIRSSERSPRQ